MKTQLLGYAFSLMVSAAMAADLAGHKLLVTSVRTGDTEVFIAGQTWASPSTPSFELPLPEVVYVGVALSSAPEGSFEARSTATFKNLSGLGLNANDPARSLSQ